MRKMMKSLGKGENLGGRKRQRRSAAWPLGDERLCVYVIVPIVSV
jgi:hypothetical protein